MDEIKTKQQVVERVKQAEKILVTVSDDPSVDALSAALALTLLLDKQAKYVTAIYSGETPPAIAFLQPEKTFDNTTDSLRDFIIALNKEKADHLRYKVEGDAVKIFITPYKTTITDKDLEFSQGDYNVELVIALGVDKQEHLDGALESHGQILHDADIITVTAGDQTSKLGGIDWHDSQASSLSEMVAGLAEALKDDKKKSLLEASSATALLTGIVAETDRFSNEHTTSRVMTVAASLMAAGADQQLIATELQTAAEKAAEPEEATTSDASADGAEAGSGDAEVDSAEGDSSDDEDSDVDIDKNSSDGEMTIKKDGLSIQHDAHETLADLDRRVLGDKKAKEKIEEEIEALEEDAESKAKEFPLVDTPENSSEPTPAVVSENPPEKPAPANAYGLELPEIEAEADEPLLGGTLNATTEEAAEDARRAEEDDKNKTILSHAYIGESPANSAAAPTAPAVSASSATKTTPSISTEPGLLQDEPTGFPGTPSVVPGSVGVNEVASSTPIHSAYALDEHSLSEPESTSPEDTSSEVSPPLFDSAPTGIAGEKVIQPLQGLTLPQTPSTSTMTSPSPADLGLPLPPPLPDFSALSALGGPIGGTSAPALPLPPSQPPAILGDILAPEPSTPLESSAPASAYAPEPGYAPETPPPTNPPSFPTTPAAPADPGQFKIPGQQ